MNAGSVLKAALVAVRKAVKAQGFVAKGTHFHRRVASGNTILLWLQKSGAPPPGSVRFTINYAVYSERLGRQLGEASAASQDILSAHWSKRIQLDGSERWIDVGDSDSPDLVASTILSAIDEIMPDLLANSSDEVLRDQWVAGQGPGLVSMRRRLFAAILVNEIGPRERLLEVVTDLRTSVAGTIHEQLVEVELRLSGVTAIPRQ